MPSTFKLSKESQVAIQAVADERGETLDQAVRHLVDARKYAKTQGAV
jgi:hypothetical protein